MTEKFSRRRIVQLSGTVAIGALAGCNESDTTETTTSGATDTQTDAAGGETTAETETAVSETETAVSETTVEETETAGAETETATEGNVTPHGSIHAHGTLVVEINGETYTLADKAWNHEANTGEPHFHFHEGSDHYHLHSEGVTMEYALDSLPKADASDEAFVFRGHEYDATSAGTSVTYLIDGEEVSLDQVVPFSAPGMRVVVETDDPTPTPVTTSA